MENSSSENTIDLRRIWALCRKHWKFLVVWTVVLGLAGFVVSKFIMTPKYTATTQLLVNQRHESDQNGQAYNNQQADIQIINTYKDIITSPTVLKQASKELADPTKTIKAQPAKYKTLADGTRVRVKKAQPKKVIHTGTGYSMSASELKDAMTVTTQTNSQVFSVAVETDSPQKSAKAANTVAKVFKERVTEMMDVQNVSVVAKAETPSAPSSPNVKRFTLAGAIIGLVLSFMIVLIRDLMNTTVRSHEFMVDELGLTNLGQINHIRLDNNFKVKQSATDNGTRRV